MAASSKDEVSKIDESSSVTSHEGPVQLLDDLDDIGEDVRAAKRPRDEDSDQDEMDEEEPVAKRAELEVDLDASEGVPTGRVTTVTKLRASAEYRAHMETVKDALKRSEPEPIVGMLEHHPEYKLVVDCNRFLAMLREEIGTVRRYLASLYGARFPELSSIVGDPRSYARVVRIVGNAPAGSIPGLEAELGKVVPASTVMVITMAGSALRTDALSEDQLERAMEAAGEMEQLCMEQGMCLSLVESRMKVFAPNLCELIGPKLTALLVGLAGGLTALSRIPGCNIQVMGKSGEGTQGMSRLTVQAHSGLVYDAAIVLEAAPRTRARVAKALASKVALAARVDAYGHSDDGSVGRSYAEELREKISKWEEPPPSMGVKALPIPEPKKSRKRGGRKSRAWKEKYGTTDVRQAANRLAMSETVEEYGDSAMGHDTGMLGVSNRGKLRIVAKQQKNLLKKAGKPKGAAVVDPLSGLTSTLVFSSTSAIELVDPQAAKEREEAKRAKINSYFNDASGFRSSIARESH
jgi:U4/U6 small nuclear ribonucleoprotein PRP31